ncbi:MAG: hypothetical protein RR131_04160 [Anaerovorax sp.]
MYNQNMFSKKKNFSVNKLLYVMLAIVILAFGYWMSQDMYGESRLKLEGDVATEAKQPVKEKKTEDGSILDSIVSKDSTHDSIDKTEPPGMTGESVTQKNGNVHQEEKTEEIIESKAYYLVKEVEGLVKIFYYNTEGHEELIRATDIEFSLLSEADQKLFSRGILRYTKDELNQLLQDFES